MIASSVIRDACPSARTLKLSADPGQRLNISLTRFNRHPDQSYGTLKDTISGNMADMTSRDRTQQLMMTVANKAQLQLTALTSDTNFLLDVQGIDNVVSLMNLLMNNTCHNYFFTCQ